MSWFKRKNEALNDGEGAAQAAPSPIEVHRDPDYEYLDNARASRQNDSERLGYDAVSLPQHYKLFKVEPIRFCQENGLSFLQSSIIKYVVRFNHKNGIEDLKKAARCLDMLIAFEEGDPDWWKLPGERASGRVYIV